MINYLTKNSKTLLMILTILTGLFVFYPQLDYIPYISQGDHGRDLYAFSRAYEGDVPYQDYWWVYGPLMPYYYGSFFKALGVTIPSLMVGKLLLIIISGVFIYLSLSLYAKPSISFLAAAWYFLTYQDFFFTFNHAGGVAAIIVTTYCLLLYLKDQKTIRLYFALISIFLTCLIKVNFGLCNLLGLTIAVLFLDKLNGSPIDAKKTRYYITSLIILPACVFSIYFMLLHKLPIYAIRQCLPYLKSDHPYNVSLGEAFKIFLDINKFHFSQNLGNMFIISIIGISILQVIFAIKTTKGFFVVHKKAANAFVILLFFYILNLHEFILSGVYYRMFWTQPFSIMLTFLIISFAAGMLSKFARNLLLFGLLFCLTMIFSNHSLMMKALKIPINYMPIERTKVFTINPPQWKYTVFQTTEFLKSNLKENETFFALPYDTLYHYLTNKKSPTRQLIFFEHLNIPAEQEEKIIKELEEKNVNWVLLSSRLSLDKKGMGIFGKTYCPILHQYINDTFEEVVRYGDWVNEPGWAWNHGTMILKRK
ncbi:MAG: glycosyltransferase family 39 protein [Candidatus Omnitrophica bacterium]|nr:glycosyltransferase family 39 protein [Candidatus Omnitrophota bacterium]MBU1995808.1 glycosyltransferase family 39 protein [Candidatus Omnitrophota bacterium]